MGTPKEGAELKLLCGFFVLILVSGSAAWGWETRTHALSGSDLAEIAGACLAVTPACTLRHYYLIDGCGLVSIAGGLEENQNVGVRFDMAETIEWHSPCDTNACLTLDGIKIVLYDALPPPENQAMNLKIFATDESGTIEGSELGNVDFEPPYAMGGFSTILIDFTNEGAVPGLDVSGCGGRCLALLTWKSSTGHPGLVMDVVSACVDSCGTNAACCAMGVAPYTYPRTSSHTFDYGVGLEPGDPEPVCDPGEGGATCPVYGYVEALWEAYFCSTSASVKPVTWGAVKALYR